MRFDKFLNSQLLALKNFCFFQFQIINNKRIMSFQEHFNITNIYKNNFNSKKQVYKYFHTQDDEYTYSEVYDYFKQYIKNLKITNSFTIIYLYTIQNNIKHQIFSKIIYGNTIRKDKFTENKTIPPPFEVFISIETYNVPISFSQNTLKKALRPTFKLKREHRPITFDDTIEKKLYFLTKSIEHGTPEEIFNLSLPYIINFQCLYKKDRIYNLPVTKSIYEIITTGNNTNECLYYIEIDTEGDTIEERTFNITITTPYKILIKITLVHDPHFIQQTEDDRQSELEELEFRLQQIKNELEALKNNNDLKTNKKCTKEETCCICLSTPSNILFPDCGHLCICENCNNNLIELKCPMCRTVVTHQKIII